MRYSASCNNLTVSLDSKLIIDNTIFVYGQNKKERKQSANIKKRTEVEIST